MQDGGGNGNGHKAPVSSHGGTGAVPPPPNGNGKPKDSKEPKERKAGGRPYKPGESGNITGAGAGRKPGLPSRNTQLGELIGKPVHPVALQFINRTLKVKFTAGTTYDELLPALAAMKFAGKGETWLLEKVLSYTYLPLTAEICQLANPPASEGGAGPGGGNVNLTLNAFEQALRETAPKADRPSFGEPE